MSVARLVPALAGPKSGFGPDSLNRVETVWPGMCGHNSLLVGQIGDWTWDAVSRLCGADVLRARNAAGEPTYLAFYYFRVRASARFHLRTPTFGDRLSVATRLFDCGREAVLALHRIARLPASDGEPAPTTFTADEFHGAAAGDHLYVENFNRWISRPRHERSNRSLVRSSPLEFRHSHLPALPAAYSPRLLCHRARCQGTFRDSTERYEEEGPLLRAEYRVDIARDLNGVGMLYFASYFSIVDWALLQWWRRIGRDDSAFLARIVVDQQVCFLGNADIDCVVVASVQGWRQHANRETEIVDVVLRDAEADRPLAVCTLRLLRSAGGAAAGPDGVLERGGVSS